MERSFPKHIYIDTSIIYNHNFNFKDKFFLKLIEFVNQGLVVQLFNDITIHEIRKNITKNLKHSREFLKTNKSSIKILFNLESIHLFSLLDKYKFDEQNNELLGRFDNYLIEAKYKNIPVATDILNHIVTEYNANNPPFDNAEKKNEFPDSIVYYSLLDWCKKNDTKAYLITSDNDFKRIHGKYQNPEIEIYDKIEVVIDLINKELNILERFSELMSDNNNLFMLEEYLKKEFEYMGFDIDYADAEVDEVEVNNVEICSTYLISFENNELIFSVNCIVQFQADVSYDNYDDAFYDKEDHVYFNVENVDVLVDDQLAFNFTVEAKLNGDELILPSEPVNGSDTYIIHFDPYENLF